MADNKVEMMKMPVVATLGDHHKMVLEELGDKHNFSWSWLGGVLGKVGPTALDLLKRAMDLGLSREWAQEAIERLGPLVLEILLDVLSGKQSLVQRLHEGEVDESGEVEQELLFEEILKRLLPTLFDKFGDQIIEALIKAILNFFDKE